MVFKARQGGTGRIRSGLGRVGGQASGVSPVFQTDFTALSSLPAQVSLSRATTATYFDTSGVLQTAATNAARFDHNPVSPFTAIGLLIEEQRSNLFLQTGSPANQTVTVVSATVYTVSFYGTGTLTLSDAATQTMNGSSATTRTAYTFTASTTSLVIAVSGSVTYPNVEAGGFATSHIITTTVAVTRGADIVQLTGAVLTALQGAAGSLAVETGDVPNTGTAYILSPSTGGGFRATPYKGGTGKLAFYNGSADVAGATFTWSSPVRAGVAWDATSTHFVGNGGTVTDAATVFGLDSSASISGAVLGGTNGSTNIINGHVRSLAIYTSRLSDTDLQTKSVVGAAF